MLSATLLSLLLLHEYRSGQSREWYKPRDTRLPIHNERSTSRTKLYGRWYSRRHQRSHLDVKVVENLLFTTTQAEKFLSMRAFFSRQARILVEVPFPLLLRFRRNIIVTTRVIVQKIAFSPVYPRSQS